MNSATELAALIEALPECAAKGALRGLVIAARTLQGEDLDPHLVTRVNHIVTSWVQKDPLRELERALRVRLGELEEDEIDTQACPATSRV